MIGFIGLGRMGTPMSRNLLRAGFDVLVWNRTPAKADELRAVGARVARDTADVFERADVVMLMLANAAAIDRVLRRGTSGFASLVARRTLVNTGTTSPDYSRCLDADVRAAGGAYVEAPVSGSRTPAESGELVGMIAGEASAVNRVRPLLDPLCRTVFECGAVPGALLMKLAVNVFLITQVTGLAESYHFARSMNVDLPTFAAILNAGQMASQISQTKLVKLIARDFEAQASITDVLANSQIISDTAHRSLKMLPLLDACRKLYEDAVLLGLGDRDMIGVIDAFQSGCPGAVMPAMRGSCSNRP
jgi:3-hydroxyisobutyrate dehydrogenase